MLSLADISEAISGRRPVAEDSVTFGEVVIDSRLASPGSLFVAIRGERQDGHEFVESAFAQGARGALVALQCKDMELEASFWDPLQDWDRLPALDVGPICIMVPDTLGALQQIAAWWRRKHMGCRVIGITGSVGKTTTKELVAAVVKTKYRVLKSPGNYNNEIGLPLTILRMDPDHQYAVLEMGMYAVGEIALLSEIALPAIGVVTNVQPVHLERLGSLERIAQAKAELVEALPKDGVAVLNGDDPLVREMAAMTNASRIVHYGLEPGNELWADEIESKGLAGIACRFHHENHVIPVEMPLLGVHSIWTALAAAGAGIACDLSWDEMCEGLRQPGEPIRMVVKQGIRGSTILDDTYNASPASSIAALGILASIQGRRIVVLGDMLELGELETRGHERVGQRVAHIADRLITVGPRGRITAGAAIAEGMSAARIESVDDNGQALSCLLDWLAPGDCVLIKGSRGMAMEEIVRELEVRS